MGIFSRMSDIINSNINHMLDKAENPEKMIKLMIQEMEDTLVEVKSQTAKIIADKKILGRQIESLLEDEKMWIDKAELAISKNRDDLAKAALEEKNRKIATRESLSFEIEEVEKALIRSKEDIKILEDKLNDARKKQKSILIRRQVADNQLKVRSQLRKANSNSAFSKFEQFERKIDRLESEVEAMGNSPSNSESTLHEEFEKLENESKVENELQELKKRLGQQSNNNEERK